MPARFICLILLAFGSNMAIASSAPTIRCDGGLISIGDPIWRVARACPEPFWREDFDEATAVDSFGVPLLWQRVETWTLNFGARRFMSRLVFVDGQLRRIDTLAYGVNWPPGSQRCTWRELELAGQTAAEIFARCGPPDFQYQLPPATPYTRSPWPGSQRQRWVYDFGNSRDSRELEFVNGQLQSIRPTRY
ncbi:MAG: DUF2845 domain-containing protein [Wenzhouxiangella sp.]